MLKVTMPASRAAPEYWIDGSKKETLADFYELESELGRWVEVQQYVNTQLFKRLLKTILTAWTSNKIYQNSNRVADFA